MYRFLTAEKNKREIKLAIAAKDILELWTELNIRARNEREEHIETGNLDSFQLSNENMQWLEQMKQSLTVRIFSAYLFCPVLSLVSKRICQPSV